MKKKQAYEIVIKDLKRNTRCKKHCIGCFDCAIRRMVEDLESFYDLDIKNAKDEKSGTKQKK